MIVTLDPQERFIEWAEDHFGLSDCHMPPETIALGVVDQDGAIHAVACLNAFYSHYASIHIASNRQAKWATKNVLRCIFGYAFHHIGLQRLNAVTSVSNVDAQVLALKLGFQFEGRTRCGADDGTDGIVFGMLSSDCRWIERGLTDGEEERASA